MWQYFNRRPGWIFLIFLLVFITHSVSPVKTPGDSRWALYTAWSLVNQGNSDLDEFTPVIKTHDYYGVETVRGHFYNRFPVGTSLLIVPAVFLLERLGVMPEKDFSRLEVVLASFFIALTAVFIFLIFQMLGSGHFFSLLAVFIFSFCSPAWSTASRALWQHGPSMMFLSAALYLLLRAEKNPDLVWLTGPLLAYSYIIRPTNSLALAVLTIYVLIKFRGEFFKYFLGVALVLAAFFIFNQSTFGAILPAYYRPDRIGSAGHFLEALAGNLFSPARGLFVYCPAFIFSFYGIYLKMKSRAATLLDGGLILIIFLHWLVISSFPHWWGGSSYGPRFFSDLTPYFVYFLAPAFGRIFSAGSRSKILAAFFWLAVVFSLYANFHGATSWSGYWWNVTPKNVDSNPERVWDWSDPQFLR